MAEFYRRSLYAAGLVGFVSTVTPHPLSAQGISDVRGLNAVTNPGDAQRLEDQARRHNQPAEDRYWRDYRAGLETTIGAGTLTPAATMPIVASTTVTRAASALLRR